MIYPIIKERDLQIGDLVYVEVDPSRYAGSYSAVRPWISVISGEVRLDYGSYVIPVMSIRHPTDDSYHDYFSYDRRWRSTTLSSNYNIFRLIKRGVNIPSE